MRMKLTKRTVEAIAVGEADVLLWDDTLRGFGVKVTPKGVRVYVLQYSFGGRSRRVTIGRHGELTVEEARRKALGLRAAVANGADPAGVRATDRAVPLLAEFAQRYLSEHAAVKKKPLSLAADERNLRNHILPAMGRLKVSAIARADVVRFHQSMKAKPGAANRCLALLSKMFNLAEKWGIRPDGSNPCRHVEKYPERSLERFLSLAELARLGAALREAEEKGEHPSVIGALRLLTFTGCRRNEILTLRWEHVDLAGGCLRLPSSKTGKRVVPLGAPALAVLAALPRREGNPVRAARQLAGWPLRCRREGVAAVARARRARRRPTARPQALLCFCGRRNGRGAAGHRRPSRSRRPIDDQEVHALQQRPAPRRRGPDLRNHRRRLRGSRFH